VSGYYGLALLVLIEGFGVPAPGETAIIVAAGYAGHGRLNIVVVGIVAFLAAVVGDSIGFWIGRAGGRRLVLRFGRYVRLTEARLDRAEQFMTRRGPIVVAAARFIEGLRQLNGVVAGVTGMPWPRFVLFNAIGGALWVGVWTTAGYLAGDHIKSIEATVGKYQWYAIGAAVVIIAGWIAIRHWRHRREAQELQ
jgi:membrane protein DedA with SNARE-associated domain